MYTRFPVLALAAAMLKFPCARDALESALSETFKARSASAELTPQMFFTTLRLTALRLDGISLGVWAPVGRTTAYHSGFLAWLQRYGVLKKLGLRPRTASKKQAVVRRSSGKKAGKQTSTQLAA